MNEFINDEMNNWFNEFDDQTIEIINKNIVENTLDVSNSKDVSNTNTTIIDDSIVQTHDSDSSEYEQFSKIHNLDQDNITITYIDVDTIILQNPEKIKSYELIHNECSISYFIQALIDGNNSGKFKTLKTFNSILTNEKILYIIEYLKWMSLVSKTLANRIGQELIQYVSDTPIPKIVRSSYNFCTKYAQCKNFYSIREEPSCTEHHYVHSLIKYDIDSIIFFLEYIIGSGLEISDENSNNLHLSIKTICFVVKHMCKEISFIDHITKNDSENFHRNNPFDTGKKKIIRKKQTDLSSQSSQSSQSSDHLFPTKNNSDSRTTLQTPNQRFGNRFKPSPKFSDNLDKTGNQGKFIRTNHTHNQNKYSTNKNEQTNGGFYNSPPPKPTDTLKNRFSILSEC